MSRAPAAQNSDHPHALLARARSIADVFTHAYPAWFVLVWFASTLFLLGDIGFWNDDYFLAQHAILQSQSTGQTNQSNTFFHFLPSPTPFDAPSATTGLWRPLLTIAVTTLLAHAWDHPWIVHALLAVSHALTALLLYAFLRTIRRSSFAASVWSLLYLCWPAHFEVALWANGFLTGVAAGCFLLCAMVYVRWARDAELASNLSSYNTARPWWLIALMMLVACLLVAANEQPAGAFLSLPLLYVASRPGPLDRATPSPRASWILLMGLPIAVIALVLAFAVGIVVLTHSGAGATTGFVAPAWWSRRLVSVLDGAWRGVGLQTVGTGAFELGLATLRERASRASLILVAVIPIALFFLHSRAKSCTPSRVNHATILATSPPLRRAALACAGLAIMLGGIIPLVLVNAEIRPRMLAIVFIGLAVFVSGITDRIALALRPYSKASARFSLLCMLLAASAIFFGTVSMIGVQRAFQIRWRTDQRLAATLRSQFPAPGANAVLMPLRCDDWPIQSSHQSFNEYFVGPYFWSFAYAPFSRIAFADPSITSSFVHPLIPLVYIATPTHALRHGPMPYPNDQVFFPSPSDTDTGAEIGADATIAAAGWLEDQLPPRTYWVAWDRVIPFVVRPEGGVDFVTQLAFRVDGLNGPIVLKVRIPRTADRADAGTFKHLTWVIDLPHPPRRK